uniref:DNA topoisomerase I n=1 Tax=Nothapodytes nimmoniana TaxID=159386 RepID=A0A097ZNA3_NOTNI|nr:topoisomerase I [Nothapodytes nimmoniana]
MDSSDDDEPLVFKRSNTICKASTLKNQNQDNQLNNLKDKKPSSSQNSSSAPKGKTVGFPKALLPVNLSPSSKASASPVKSPIESTSISLAADKVKENSSAVVKKDVAEQSTGIKTLGSDEFNNNPDGDKPLNTEFSAPGLSSKGNSVKEEQKDQSILKSLGIDDSDSEDDNIPLSARLPVGSRGNSSSSLSKKGPVSGTSNGTGTPSPIPTSKLSVKSEEDSDDEKPLASKLQVKSNEGALVSRKPCDSNDKRKPLASPQLRQNGFATRDNYQLKVSSSLPSKRPLDQVKSSGDQSSTKKPKVSNSASKPITSNKHGSLQSGVKTKDADEEEDHLPISQRVKKTGALDKSSSSTKQKMVKVSSSSKKINKNSKKVVKKSKYSVSSKVPPGSGEGQKWTTLVHKGVIFPPPYKPHGVKMLYKRQTVDLTPEQEEVATMYAVMLDTDYMNKSIFKQNFFTDWKKILGKNHVIQNLEDCDFTPIYEWHQKEKEKKKQMTKDEKQALREETLKREEKFMWAIVDGVKEKVGNFRVEPPSLFRGRGEHPKTGKLKKRIRPSDITINIGKDAPIPECPIPGERWKEIRHDNTVTWLAYWADPIKPKEFKYVFLGASSSLKGQSDKEKYEKARMLKDYVQGIRAAYTKDFASRDLTKQQIAVATYLIDKLALRAGNEKDEDEADTVGCCTLKVENVELKPPNILEFDFIGKDSIRYQNVVEVELAVFKAIQQFQTGKKSTDDLFNMLDTSKLNAHLKELMPGLTAKVFRTYNASITLDEMLSRETKDGDVAEKIVVYQHANKEVAIICNHQRTVSKSHGAQMLRLNEKLEELKGALEEMKTDLARAKKGKPPLQTADGKPKRNLNPEGLERKIAQTNLKIEKMERLKETKEDLKTVALGTSKLNYLDPRITVAWCKRHEVPIEKIFNKSLLAKFTWAMDVDPSFRF